MGLHANYGSLQGKARSYLMQHHRFHPSDWLAMHQYGIVIGDRIGKYAAPKSSAKAGVWTPYAPAESSSFDEAAYLAELRRKYVIRTGGHLRVLQDFRGTHYFLLWMSPLLMPINS